MVELVAERAWAGDPLEIGSVVLSPLTWSGLHSIAPFRGRTGEVAAILGAPFDTGCVVNTPVGRLIWVGLGQWFLEGTPPPLGESAALTDQSDAWVGMRLTGADAVAVLARLTPVDPDPAVFPAGRVARTMLGHLQLVLIALPEGFDLLVMRSFAGTALHEIETAMRAVAARKAL